MRDLVCDRDTTVRDVAVPPVRVAETEADADVGPDMLMVADLDLDVRERDHERDGVGCVWVVREALGVGTLGVAVRDCVEEWVVAVPECVCEGDATERVAVTEDLDCVTDPVGVRMVTLMYHVVFSHGPAPCCP